MMSLADLLQTGSANLNNFALVHDTEGEVPPISYGGLHQACKTIADKLHLAGLASGDVVALVAPHSIHSAATMIGLVRCGLVCAPVDPATSSKRFKEVLEETGAKMLLVPTIAQSDSASALEAAESLGLPVWRFQSCQSSTIDVVPLGDTTTSTPAPGPQRDAPPPSIKPTDVAFLLHTSGTTNRPKLVSITHGAVVANLKGLVKTYALSSKDVALHVLPFFHVAGIVIGLFSTLAAGGCVVIQSAFDPLAFPQLLRKHKVTWFTAVPAMFKAFLEHRGFFKTQNDVTSALRFVRSGAAPMNPKDVQALEALLGVPFVDSYGMTETAGGCVSTLPGIITPLGSAGVSISPGLEIKICDDVGNEVPLGESGEVCLRGPSVTTGYVDNATANEESFFGEKWFRTGDLGYLHSIQSTEAAASETATEKIAHRDSTLWNHASSLSAGPWLILTGRKKEMINRGGEKVSPTEVEDAVLLVEAVAAAVAFPMADATYGEQVAVAAVKKKGIEVEEPESLAYSILAACRRSLTAYMVPTVIFILEDDSLLPKTSTGKVQRMATLAKLTSAGIEPTCSLSSQLNARIISSYDYLAADSALEKETVQLWEKVLGLGNIGVVDDFFELGGTSILAARIAFMVQERNGKQCSGAFVLQNRSIRALCKALESLPSAAPSSQAPSSLEYVNTTPSLTLSSGQEQMLMLYSRDPTSGSYNQPLILGLFGSINVPRLSRCIESMVARHDALQTTYAATKDGSWVPVIDPSLKVTLHQVDLSCTELVTDSAEFENMLVKDSFAPFDLFKELPIRARLYTLSSCNVLLLVVHHIASDGWSMNNIQNELAALYNEKDLPAVDVPYSAYARWQRDQFSSEAYNMHLDYWKKQLAGIEPLLLQPDHQRPAVQKYDGALHTFRVSADILSKLKGFSQAHGATLFMTTLAAFQIHMYKLTGMERFAIGSPAAGRLERSLEATIGYFVNSLALVADLSGNPTVAEYLERVKTTVYNGLENASVPFTQIVESVRQERSTSYTPVFQLMFVLQERALDSTRSLGDGLEMKRQRLNSGVTAKFDLTMELFDEGEAGLLGRMEYCTSLFTAETVERWSQQFVLLLHQLAQASETHALTINNLSLMPETELDLVQGFSIGEERPEYLSAPLIHEAFDAVAASSPTQRCLCYEGEWLNYLQASQRVSQLADHLIYAGVKPGVVVAIMLERSFDLVVSIMAVFKAGGCYLPCDPSYPDDRLAIYLEDAAAKIVLVQEQYLQRAESMVGAGVPVLDVSLLVSSKPHDKKGSAAVESAGPEDPAYIIFTSGSTGRPKAVVIPHRGVRDLMPCLVDQFKLNSTDTIIFANTINFDASIIQALPGLTVGAGLVIAKPEGHLDASYIVQLLLKNQAQEYVAELKRATSGPYPLMKAWGMGGESCPAALVREMQEIFPNIIGPFNMYGPTEVTAVTVQHAFSKSFDTVVIGKPDPNTHVYIVDSSLHPVPIGVPGELLLSGPRLALGYAGRPDLTKDKFVPNPCLDIVSSLINPLLAPYYQNVYRTGDLVRWRSDGTIDFLGRIDRQIKISGVRIELGEVEAALEGAEGVSGAIAAAIADPTGTKRLVGYITPADVDTAAVTTHCRALLVAAMVPSVLISLESFPLLPNGKIDVRALPAPDWSGAGEEEYVAPADDAEAAVQRVFAEVLGRPAEELSVLADFFAAGGTSLQVFRAAALLQGAFEIASVPATLIHSERSARSVAAALTAFVADGVFNTPIPCNDWPDALRPLSANQEQMWLLSSLAGASAYNMPSALDFFAGAPDAQLLSAALDAVAGRHDVLRTVFTSQKDGSMAGIVLPASDFRVPVEVVEMTVSEEEVVREVAAETARSFDLESEPLVRAKLIMRGFPGGNGAVLALTMHHAVGDAWSQGVFWRELSVAYDALSAGKSPVWSPLPIQYADYAAWQREQLSGVSGDALRAFWKTTLAGAPAMVQLPQDRPRPSNPTFENGIARSSLPDGLLSKLESVARSLRVNMQAVLLAGLQAVLLRYTGQDDLVLGVPVAGRDRQETHGLVGYFINTLPVRCSASEEATFEDMVLSASKATLAALENSLLPLEEVVAAANIPRAPNVNPLFQILFQYFPEDTGNQPTRLGNNEYTPYARAGGLSMAKMDLILTISGGSLKADYMAELFDDLTITRIMRSFVGILEQLASSIKAPALAGSLLGNEEKEEVVAVSIGAQRPEYLSLPLVHDAISKVAIDSPDRQCLFFEGEWLSYGEVNARANTLAGQLSALGVESGVVVGLMLERSFELVVSILAVLKAGGCYLPCDPSYPDDRLTIYLDDAKTIVVLTQAKHFERARNMVGSGVEVIDVNKLSQENGGQSKYAAAPLKPPSPEDPAYIIFTSGSTGRPKGVMVPHRGLKDLMPWLVDMYHLNEKDAIIFSNTISFDAHVLQVFPPLTVGATLIIARPEGHFDPGYIVDLILDQTITGFMFTVPTLAREYVNEYKRRGLPPYLPMRSWGVGGESVPADVVRSMHEVFPNLEPINTYGPTEVTAVAVHYQFPRGFETVVIGRPDANLIAVIVDAALCPVPVGVPGELLLSGPRLGLGYAGRPDLTEEKFISNPCLDLFAGRVDPALLPYYQKVYRTGDLVRWRSDGNIDFMGRIDRQVKITGVRIELGEVEAALESTEGVAQAVAAAVADPSGQKRLVGYVTPGNVDMALVRSHCRSLLVPAMVPTVVTALDAFPLLPNGKVDVKSLPEPDWTAQASNPANMTARERTNVPAASVSDEHSVAVLNAIGDILGLEVSEIPVNAELFELGASSIQIAAIVGKIRKELGVSLDLRSVYADALIVKLCAAVRLEKGGDEHNQSAKSSAKHRILGYPIPIWSPSPRIQGIAQRALQSAFQLLAVTFLMLCLAASMLPGFSLIKYASAHLSTSSAIVIAPLAYFIWAASLMLISAAAKWILVRRYTSGAHPVWCFFFMRWWIVHRLVRITEKIALGYLSGTPFLFYYLQLMGATIDSNACINTCSVTDFDLIFIGKDSVVGESVLITGHSIERGFLVLQEVNIGSGCHVGAHSVVMPGASLDNGVSLEAMSMVPLGAALPPNTAWEGSPVRPKEKNAAAGDAAAPAAGIEEGQQLSPSDVNKYKYVGIAVSIAMTWIALLPLAIAVVYLWQTSLVLVSFAAGFGFIAANVIYMAEAILLKWIVLGGRLKPGKYKANSTYAVRFSLVQSWLTMAPLAKSFCALFAHTSAMPIVLRALGAKLKGKNVIFGMSSTMLAGADQILLGEFATLGYGAAALGAVISGNELLIAPTIVEESCFIADGAVVMPGCCLGKGSLVGVQSIIQPYSNLAQGSVWSGSPAFRLDPGLSGAESVVSSSGKTVQKLKKQITRWQSSQKALLQRPNSKVLSSRGLVHVRTARTFEGNSMLLKTLSEDVDYTDDDENTSATNVRLAWKASLVGRGITKTSSGGSAKHGRSFHTSSAESSRSNTFLRRTSTAFSQASMIVEQLKEVKQTGSNYDRLSILVPSLVLPCWIFVALVVPLYCLNDAPGTSSGSIMSLLNYSTSFLMLFGATIAGLLVLTKIIIIGSFDVASYSMDGSSNSTALLHSTNLEVLCTAASTLGLDAIMGTQGAAWCLAALGARVGSDVFLENLPLVEADLLTLEDGVTIGRGTRIATYIVENGCMDFLNVHVAAEITFGPRSYSMPGVTFEKQSALGALSVAMKGETVSQGKYMEGSPLICVGTWYETASSGQGDGAGQPPVPAENLAVVEQMQRDAQLPAEIKLPEEIVVRTGSPSVVLLTGATGYVGAFILRELLENASGIKKVYCLVRASSVEQGVERIKKQLLHHGLCTEKNWKSVFAHRVYALPGDLGQPRLGQTEGVFQDLCDEVDVVINNGALVNLSKGYDFMYAANVGAVLELLRLCIGGRALTPLHNISTVGTLPPRGDHVNLERFDAKGSALSMPGGYNQTKWVSEELISQANDRGLPVALYRLGRIGGDSKNGCGNESDFCMLILKGCLQMGCFPREHKFDLNIIPGDMTAKVLVNLALNSSGSFSSLGRVYHVTNPRPPPFQLALTVLRDMGYEFEEISYIAWRERLLSCSAETNALRPLEMAFGPFAPSKSIKRPMTDSSNAGIKENTTSAEMLKRDFTWFKKVGFFPAEAGKTS